MLIDHLPSTAGQKKLIVILRITAVIAGIYQIAFGDLVIGIYIMLATAAIMLPGVFTRNYIKSVPLELELIFSIMVLLQLVIGETIGFYHLVPYYDKFIHFSLPFFVGLIGFLLAYTLHKTGGLRMTTMPLLVIIVLITMGIGATWEIIEYTSDTFLSPHLPFLGHLQGNASETPLVDTMNDLILDMFGGLFGAVLSLRYIRAESMNKNSRLAALMREIARSFGKT